FQRQNLQPVSFRFLLDEVRGEENTGIYEVKESVTISTMDSGLCRLRIRVKTGMTGEEVVFGLNLYGKKEFDAGILQRQDTDAPSFFINSQ
ncbi:MAG: hypothetical protein KAH38_07105, partial [Candidatus Hydrogenedentes bacterium]|nr:hypothetical protein [Candidatus Hydrogenedentota bacterium]